MTHLEGKKQIDDGRFYLFDKITNVYKISINIKSNVKVERLFFLKILYTDL